MKQCIYVNGDILTMDERQTAQAVLVQNGKIAYVGSKEEAKAKALPNTPQVDLQGRCMMPAFIDPHSHFSGMANGRLQVDLGECTSFAQIEQAVRQFVMQKSIAPGPVGFGQGVRPQPLAGKSASAACPAG